MKNTRGVPAHCMVLPLAAAVVRRRRPSLRRMRFREVMTRRGPFRMIRGWTRRIPCGFTREYWLGCRYLCEIPGRGGSIYRGHWYAVRMEKASLSSRKMYRSGPVPLNLSSRTARDSVGIPVWKPTRPVPSMADTAAAAGQHEVYASAATV